MAKPPVEGRSVSIQGRQERQERVRQEQEEALKKMLNISSSPVAQPTAPFAAWAANPLPHAAASATASAASAQNPLPPSCYQSSNVAALIEYAAKHSSAASASKPVFHVRAGDKPGTHVATVTGRRRYARTHGV